LGCDYSDDLQILSSEGYTIWDSDARLVTVQVERGTDESDLIGLELIFSLEGDSVSHYFEEVPEVNSRKVYYLNLSDYSGNLLSISIVPVFKSGKAGNVLSKIYIQKIGKADIEELIDSGEIPDDFIRELNGGFGSREDGGVDCVEGECDEGECVEEVPETTCDDVLSCGDYSELECDTDVCELGCSWNASSGNCEDEVVQLSVADYYVDVNLGNDCSGDYNILNRDCSGIDGDAYNTIQEAVDVVQAGETVLVREGIYEEELDLSDSENGNAQEGHVTYKAYPGEKVVLTGLKELTGWIKCSNQIECDSPFWDNIYYTDIPGDFGLSTDTEKIERNAVFIDNEKINFAHWPNQDSIYWPWNKNLMHNPSQDGTSTTLTDTVNLIQQDGLWNGYFLKMHFGSGVNSGNLYDIIDFSNNVITVSDPLLIAPRVSICY